MIWKRIFIRRTSTYGSKEEEGVALFSNFTCVCACFPSVHREASLGIDSSNDVYPF